MSVTEMVLRERARENGLTPPSQRYVEQQLRDLDALCERAVDTVGVRLANLKRAPMRVEVDRREIADLWAVFSTLVNLTQALTQEIHKEVVEHTHEMSVLTKMP